MAKIATLGFLAALVLYTALVAAAYWGQRALQYAPTHRDRKGYGLGVLTPWRDQAGDFLGYVRAAVRPERVVVLFHGTGGEALNWAWYQDFVPANQTLVLAEYPGFGARGGKPSEVHILRAAMDLMARVRLRWPVPVTLVGESLGTGVACYVASHVPVDRLALVSPFTSVLDLAEYHLPFLPVSALLKDRFRSSAFIGSVHVPLYVMHGDADEVVPVDFGRRLFDAYLGTPKFFTAVPGAGHYSINRAISHAGIAAAFRAFVAGAAVSGLGGSLRAAGN